MKALNKTLCFILALAFVLPLTACGESRPSDAYASDQPTEAPVVTEAPAVTDAPTEAPAETPAPTVIPEPIQYDFASWAEKVMELPVGEGDSEIKYSYDEESGLWAPYQFMVCGNEIHIREGASVHVVYNMETGEMKKEEAPFGMIAAILDDCLVLLEGEYDSAPYDTALYYPETGERVRLPQLTGDFDTMIHSIFVREGKCYALAIKEHEFEDVDRAYGDDVILFELDVENRLWIGIKLLCEPRVTDEIDDWSGYHWSETYFPETDVTLDTHCGGLMGITDDGSMFFERFDRREIGGSTEFIHQIKKYSPYGYLQGYFDIPFGRGDLAGTSSESVFLAEDGGVYVTEPLEDSFIIWRITL